MRFLAAPRELYREVTTLNFERQVHEYLVLLCLGGFFGALVIALAHMGKGLYVSLIHSVTIQYWPLINYAGGNGSAVFFFYLFSGTFLLFIGTLIVRPFAGKIRYVHLMNIFFLALTPLILFAWIIPAIPGLLIWSGMLLIIGIKTLRTEMEHQDRTALTQRD